MFGDKWKIDYGEGSDSADYRDAWCFYVVWDRFSAFMDMFVVRMVGCV